MPWPTDSTSLNTHISRISLRTACEPRFIRKRHRCYCGGRVSGTSSSRPEGRDPPRIRAAKPPGPVSVPPVSRMVAARAPRRRLPDSGPCPHQRRGKGLFCPKPRFRGGSGRPSRLGLGESSGPRGSEALVFAAPGLKAFHLPWAPAPPGRTACVSVKARAAAEPLAPMGARRGPPTQGSSGRPEPWRTAPPGPGADVPAPPPLRLPALR